MTLPAKKSLKEGAESRRAAVPPKERKRAVSQKKRPLSSYHESVGNRALERLYRDEEEKREKAAKSGEKAPKVKAETKLKLPPPKAAGAQEVQKPKALKLQGSSEKMVADFAKAPASQVAATFPALGKALSRRVEEERVETFKNAPKLTASVTARSGRIKGGVVKVRPKKSRESLKESAAPPLKELKPPEHRDFGKPPENRKALESVEREVKRDFKSWFKSHFRSFLSSIRTTDPNVNTKADMEPKVDLKGEIDPKKAQKDKTEALKGVAERREVEVERFVNHPGQSHILPKEVNETFETQIGSKELESVESAEEEGMKNYLEAEIPKEVRERADELLKPVLEGGLKKLNKETGDAAKRRDESKRREEAQKVAEAEKLNRRAQKEQEDAVITGRRQVASEQQKGIEEAHKATREFEKEADKEHTKVKKSISDRVKKAESEAKKEIQKGEEEAEKIKRKGEEQARQKKSELKKKQKQKSWWDRAVDAIKSAVKAITKAIDKIFTEIRKAVKKAIEAAKKLAVSLINRARKFILERLEAFRKWAKKMVNRYLKKYFPALARRINKAIDRFVDRAKKAVNKIADKLIAGVKALADALSKALDKILSAFQTALKAAVQIAGAVLTGNFSEALKIAIQAACDIAGIDSKPIFGFFRRAGALFAKILKSPRKFFNNLVEAVGGGVRSFAKNIKKHLINGLFAWLTGVLSEAQIELPEKFDAKGIFSLAMQILGVTYANIKARIIRKYPKAAGVIEKIEKGFAILKELVTKGPAALWKRVASMLRNFKESVISGIRDFVVTTLVKEGILWLLSLLNPASAIVKVIKLLYDLVMFLVESFDKIKAFVVSVYNSIAAIAAGTLGPAKKAVEMSLAKILPVAINLLARLAGLGGIAKTVRKIIARLSRPVNKVIDKIIDKAVAFAKKLLGRGKRGLKKVRKGLKRVFKIDKRVGRRISFPAKKERHALWIGRRRGKLVPMVASTPAPVVQKLDRWEKELGKLKEPERKKASELLETARSRLKVLEERARREDEEKKMALKDKKVTQEEAAEVKREEKSTQAAEKSLSDAVKELIEIFGEKRIVLQKLFGAEIGKMHPKAGEVFVKQLGKIEAEKIRSWSDLKKKVTESGKMALVYNKPLSSGHPYGISIQEREAKWALAQAEKEYEKETKGKKTGKLEKKSPEKFIQDRVGTVHTQKAPYTKEAYGMLREYVFDRGEKPKVIKSLKAYYLASLERGSQKEHKEYKPVIDKDGMKLKNGVFEIDYTYEGDEHKKKRFKVTFDFSQIDTESEITQSTKGENLKLKKPGKRGKTVSSGELSDFEKYKRAEALPDKKKLVYHELLKSFVKRRFNINKPKKIRRLAAMSDDELLKMLSPKDEKEFDKELADLLKKTGYLKSGQKFDSAHMLADWFGGSGYKEALNLVVTSAEYNRVIMGGAEKKIVEEVKSVSPESIFDLTVTATWDVLKDSEMKSKINAHSIRKQLGGRDPMPTDERKELAEGAEKELYDILSSRQDPRRVLRVRYEGKIKKPANEALQRREIGCDIWMSSFFKFEKKEKCFL